MELGEDGLGAAFAGDDYEDADYVAPDSDSDQEEDEPRSRKRVSRAPRQATPRPRAKPRVNANTKAKAKAKSKAPSNAKTRSTGQPLSDDDDDDDDEPWAGGVLLPPSAYRPYQRKSTVYDCTAGRMHSWLPGSLRLHEKQDPWDARSELSDLKRARIDALGREKPYDARRRPMPPQDVLSSFSGAPTRYAEYDVYRPHAREPGAGAPGRRLPSSLLLSTLHTYAGRMYGAAARQHWLDNHKRIYKRYGGAGKESSTSSYRAAKMRARLMCAYERLQGGLKHDNIDERSMDETALLALGILMEEAAAESLGKNGFLVLTEGDGQYEANNMHRRQEPQYDDDDDDAQEVYTDDNDDDDGGGDDDDDSNDVYQDEAAVGRSKRRTRQTPKRPRKKARRTA